MTEYVSKGYIASPAGYVIIAEGFIHGAACVNMTNLCMVDGTDVFELTRAEIFTRNQVL